MNYCWVATHILAQCDDGGELLLFSIEGAKHVLQETNLQEGRELQASKQITLPLATTNAMWVRNIYTTHDMVRR